MIKSNLFCLFCLLFLLSCKQPVVTVLGNPSIKAGTTKISGRIIRSDGAPQDSIRLFIGVPNPISGEYVKQETLTDRSGNFTMNVAVETDITLISLYTSLRRDPLYIKLTNGGMNKIDISYSSNFDIENIDVSPAGMTQNDMKGSVGIMVEMSQYHGGAPKPLYDKGPDVFLTFAKNSLSKRLEILNHNPTLSKEIKGLLAKDFRLFQYSGFVFDYEKYMLMNYRNLNRDTVNKPDIKKIDRSYFRFLRDFKLNDPQYLNCYSFLEGQQKILRNEIIGLPEIGELLRNLLCSFDKTCLLST